MGAAGKIRQKKPASQRKKLLVVDAAYFAEDRLTQLWSKMVCVKTSRHRVHGEHREQEGHVGCMARQGEPRMRQTKLLSRLRCERDA